MKGPRQPGVTIILEDAYKQNTVYRPWREFDSEPRDDESPRARPEGVADDPRPVLADRITATINTR